MGDRQADGGFAVWVVAVQLGSLFLGAGFGSFLARPGFTAGGAAIGAFTWALALVLGSAIAARPLAGWRPENAAAAAWTTFFGALLSLGTAMLGGAYGSRRARRSISEIAGSFTGRETYKIDTGVEGESAIVTEDRIVTVTPVR